MTGHASETTRTSTREHGPQERVLKAGRDLFFEHGFSAVSTDMLAKHAKVSKASLYKHYSNMSEVLVAVMRAEASRFETGVPNRAETWDDFRDALIQYGTNLLRFLNDPEIIRFTQLVYEESRLHPAVAGPFFSAALEETHRQIASLLKHGESVGYLECSCTPEETAEQLMGMWEPLRWTKALLGLTSKPYPQPKVWATKCVDALVKPRQDTMSD